MVPSLGSHGDHGKMGQMGEALEKRTRLGYTGDMNHVSRSLLFLSLLMFQSHAITALAALRSDQIHPTTGKKHDFYIKEGMFVGGDRAIDDVIVKGIRRAAQKGYDRIVIDLEANKKGEAAVIERPPYFQAALAPAGDTVSFTIWGSPKLSFDAKKTSEAIQKSPDVSKVEIFPKLEKDSWTFVIRFKSKVSIEAFELTKPVRLILDFKPVTKPKKL